MTDADGKKYKWTVQSFKNATNVVLGKKPRLISGWSYTDHEGYTRCVEGNWIDLVGAFDLTATNYGFRHNLS